MFHFLYSDKLIEETVGGTAIADIFKLHGESLLREHEVSFIETLDRFLLRPKTCFSLVTFDNYFFFLSVYYTFFKTEVLRKLSSMDRNVISTGGGAVVKPINWYDF